MDPIKEAFLRAKQDIDELRVQLTLLSNEISNLKSMIQTNKPTNTPSISTTLKSQQKSSSLQTPTSSDSNTLTLKTSQYGVLSSNNDFSTGNRGVPTNQPTNQQTNQHPIISTEKFVLNGKEDRLSHLKRVSEILDSLDSIKKELRTKFKRLSNQEMLVFSTIYQLQEQGFIVDYSLLSEQLSLTEISIRDYVRKITQKGIPISKSREPSNKKILLSIPEELKRITSLQTLQRLREI